MAQGKNIQHSSLRSQGTWLLSAKIGGFAIALVLPLIVVRILTQEEFGLYRQVFLVVMNAVAILPFGISMSAYYYLARDKSKRASAILNILLVHFAVGAVAFLLLLLYPEFLGLIFNSDEMSRLAPLVGIAIWFWLFSVFLEHAAVANREPRKAATFIVFAQFSKTALMAVFVIWFGTVTSIITAAIIQSAVQSVILIWYLYSRFPGFLKSFDLDFLKEHLRYTLPYGLAGILGTLLSDLHYYFVGHHYGDAAYAIYVIGCFQLPLIAVLGESVASVLIPRMSELQLQNDTKEMIRITARAIRVLALVYFPAFVFLFVTAEMFITTLFTDKFSESVPIFQIFLVLLPITILVSDPVVRVYKSLGMFRLKLRIAIFVVLVAGLFYGIERFDMLGVVMIVVTARIAERIIIQLAVFRRIGFRPADFNFLRKLGITAAVSVLSGTMTFGIYETIRVPIVQWILGLANKYMASPNSLIIDFVSGMVILATCFIGFLTVYFTIAFYAGIIEDSEKKLLLRLFNKRLVR